MTSTGWVVMVILVSLAIAMIYFIFSLSNKKKLIDKEIQSINDFSPSQKFIGILGETAIAVDEVRKKIALISDGADGIKIRTFTHRDILSSEIYEDGETVTKTSRGSQLGGVLLGGLLLGGAGAIIGGLSGKTRTSGIVNKIDFRVTVNDKKNPLHDIKFLLGDTKKDSFLYTNAMEKARHLQGLITILIKESDDEDDKLNSTVSIANKNLLADEILKLSDLRDRGILTDDEFLIQKNKILSI